jgi:HAD superfamily hydrolase (TIGR01509 family)
MLCLIFDLDGTLVDSEPLCSQAFLDLLPDLDDTVAGLMHRYRGMQLARVFADLSLRSGKSFPEDFEATYRARVAQLYDERLAPMPGAIEVLSSLPNSMCVASNGPIAKMAHGLRVAGLARFFGENIFSAYQVGHWKPEPQLFLHAARKMNYSPDQCLVVEDSDAGLQAAEAAGMRAIHFNPAGVHQSGSACANVRNLHDLPDIIHNLAPSVGRAHDDRNRR